MNIEGCIPGKSLRSRVGLKIGRLEPVIDTSLQGQNVAEIPGWGLSYQFDRFRFGRRPSEETMPRKIAFTAYVGLFQPSPWARMVPRKDVLYIHT